MPSQQTTVQFYIQRHGAHTAGELNDQGKAQVAASAKKHLAGIEFHHFMSSEMMRARETVVFAGHAVNCPFEKPTIDPSFGFSFADDMPLEEETPYEAFCDKVARERQAGRPVNVDFTFEHWKPAQIIAAVLHTTMRHWAERLTAFKEAARMNVLVGSHATCSLAALDRANTNGAPNNADIHVYTWEVSRDDNTELIASEHLPAPDS